ncbi:isoleucine--tRNA ligase [Helicobacter cappadocius]|uniref:Isoleucine--tRNA ligase n=1 Tax=Helicobacter cappadocius TaxID=3063998 RepID=A0AA90PYY0_9HELI|nr:MULTISPECIES: isoleucine--tRNA ligase [unclassified Helicobacter]MDO7253224.1 isoleucine--tRNA ligase [Helicobacter sp. faydin-H75]MDP2539148.1 isoleucine--tRNA ligase [Helicobacter sp. faydin-H76]
MDYKDTLILPQTDFPMRGNLPVNEPLRYKKWQENQVYNTKMKKNRSKAKESNQNFNLHDGPPYANGHLHIGHALNKILKDIIIKYHYFQGYSVRYTPGWDCHGLPIEQQVEKKIGKEKKDTLPKQKIRELCRAHASEFIAIQSQEFQQLGILGDFENPYKTMDFRFESDIYKVLCEVAKNGLLCERSKPIYWSWACETALADAEVEYKDKESDSVFVAFSLKDDALRALGIDNASIVIWTTTPWTLPANAGIALKPGESYVLTKKGYIVAKELHNKLYKNQIIDEEISKEFLADTLEGLKAINPLNGRDSLIILGDHVSMNDGTGAVHNAPAHGEDDYHVGLKYNLPIIMAVDDKGCFNEVILKEKILPEEFVGIHIFKAQEKIIKMLGNALLKHSKITHSYPHCWRSHEPVIYRATTQWFISMDKPFKDGKTLREVALEAIDETKFYPQSGKNRIRTMVQNRPDWCISRQRDWGVPIAFFRDKKSGEVIFDTEVLEHLSDIFEKEGCDAWWSKEIKELLPTSWAHRADNLEKGKHILDVWFDSGSTWSAVLKNTKNNPKYDAGDYPADVYLEGSDQHRGWFQSSLLLSCALNGKAPFKSVVTHGFTVDENGEKMSKSKGNVIGLDSILKEYGSDILRLWVAMNDYQSDLTVSVNFFKQIAEQYRKIRNTIRFLLANIDGLESLVEYNNLGEIDRWIVKKADEIFSQVQASFDEYEFVKGLSLLMGFLTNELSGIYLDLCKDSLYCDAKNSPERQAHQSAMTIITRNLLHLLAPILTYSVDEVLEFAPKVLKGDINDVFDLEKLDLKKSFNLELKTDFEELLKIREGFGEAVDGLKKDKIIKSSLELCIQTKNNVFKELDKWLIISEVKNEDKKDEPLKSFKISNNGIEKTFLIFKTSKHKCPRCWRYLCKSEEELCVRCQEVCKGAV